MIDPVDVMWCAFDVTFLLRATLEQLTRWRREPVQCETSREVLVRVFWEHPWMPVKAVGERGSRGSGERCVVLKRKERASAETVVVSLFVFVVVVVVSDCRSWRKASRVSSQRRGRELSCTGNKNSALPGGRTRYPWLLSLSSAGGAETKRGKRGRSGRRWVECRRRSV
jgi:hypothetical protein